MLVFIEKSYLGSFSIIATWVATPWLPPSTCRVGGPALRALLHSALTFSGVFAHRVHSFITVSGVLLIILFEVFW